MKLYSFHNLEYDLITQVPDYKKSPFYLLYDFNHAYDFLYSLIPQENYIWCYPSLSNFAHLHTLEQRLYIFDYDIDKLPYYAINGYVWDLVIHNTNDYPDSFYDLPSEEALQAAEREFDKNCSKFEYWRRNLLVCDPINNPQDTQFLIPYKHAVKNITANTVVSSFCPDTVLNPDPIYRVGFKTFQSANKFLNVIKSIYKKYNWAYNCSIKTSKDGITAFIEKI